MKNLELWLRPAALLSIWILVAALTVAELGTVRPVLLAAAGEAAQAREPAPRTREARLQPARHRLVAR